MGRTIQIRKFDPTQLCFSPGVLVVGPRCSGKTSVAQKIVAAAKDTYTQGTVLQYCEIEAFQTPQPQLRCVVGNGAFGNLKPFMDSGSFLVEDDYGCCRETCQPMPVTGANVLHVRTMQYLDGKSGKGAAYVVLTKGCSRDTIDHFRRQFAVTMSTPEIQHMLSTVETMRVVVYSVRTEEFFWFS